MGRFSLEMAFIIQEKEFRVAKTYHARRGSRGGERENMNVFSPSLSFGAKNGLHTFVNSLVDRGRQVGKCLTV